MAKSKKLGVRKKENVDVLCYRFAALPTKEQIIQLNKTIGCCRYLWNRMLGDHNTLYHEIGIVPNNTPADYKNLEECLWLKEVDSLALANVQLNLNQAFQKFFNGEAKHPRFKKKKVCKDSFTTNNVSGNIRMEGNGIRLPKLGILTLIRHRKIKAGGKLKSVTVCHEKDGKWYCSISFEYPKAEQVYPEPSADMKHIGLDMSALKQTLNLGKSYSDNGWGMFVTMLLYKGKRNGCYIIKIDKWFPSSKTCSECGYVHKELQLSERTYVCPVCGNLIDRDEQAAINIDLEGLRILLSA